jgi:hypothetical protein
VKANARRGNSAARPRALRVLGKELWKKRGDEEAMSKKTEIMKAGTWKNWERRRVLL